MTEQTKVSVTTLRDSRVRNLCLAALMSAIMAVCAWITVPFTVPFTMQIFAVFAALLILGGRWGTASIAFYLFVGAMGLPVFSGFQGGIGHVLGPTGGYMLGFLAIGAIYWAFESPTRKRPILRIPVLVLGLAACYLLGTLWFTTTYVGANGAGMGFVAALGVCVVPYIIPDLLKLTLAYVLGKQVANALDQRA